MVYFSVHVGYDLHFDFTILYSSCCLRLKPMGQTRRIGVNKTMLYDDNMLPLISPQIQCEFFKTSVYFSYLCMPI